MNDIRPEDITAVVLAGGQGSRMGGRDKGLVSFRGKSLVSHAVDAIRQQLDRVIINANRNLDDYAALGLPVISDELTGFQGPLAGFLAALDAVETSYILTLPCDGPVVHPDYAARMRQAINSKGADIVVASDGAWMQPVYALVPRALRDDLAAFLASGERKIDRWYARHDTYQQVFPADSGFFTNINTLQELETTP